jgi:hypothetical protein
LTGLLQPLTWLAPVADLAKLGAFLLFLFLGWRAGRGPREASWLLGYVSCLTMLVGVLQHEAWPFTNWALVHHAAASHVVTWDLEGEDAQGVRYRVDPAVLQPLAPEEFGSWALYNLPRLPPAGRDRVGRFLLEAAEAGRKRWQEGRAPGRNGWVLGPLAAPYHFLPGHEWKSPADVPQGPFVRIRFWRFEWDAGAYFEGDHRKSRSLLLESPKLRAD